MHQPQESSIDKPVKATPGFKKRIFSLLGFKEKNGEGVTEGLKLTDKYVLLGPIRYGFTYDDNLDIWGVVANQEDERIYRPLLTVNFGRNPAMSSFVKNLWCPDLQKKVLELLKIIAPSLRRIEDRDGLQKIIDQLESGAEPADEWENLGGSETHYIHKY